MRRKHQAGFTLIELLVVTSIISLLSSVVLGAVNNARIKANNKQTLAIANEYRNAIELYRANDPNGGFPKTGDVANYYCLGSYAPNACGYKNVTQGGAFNLTGSAQLKTALSPYLPTLPAAKRSDSFQMGFDQWVYDGPTYLCNNEVNGVCTKAVMTWVYGNNDNNCLGPSAPSSIGYCLYTFE